VGDNWWGQCDVSDWTDIKQVAAGWYHTVGLRTDGTVVAMGETSYGECNVGGWRNVTQVAAAETFTVGLKSDGTAVCTGYECDVGTWTDIVQVAAGRGHAVGLKSDGTVVAAGYNDYEGQCNVANWTNITQVAAGWYHTVGVKKDGTVVATGPSGGSWDDYGQCNVTGWGNITQVAAGGYHTVGLKADGTVVGVGDSFYGQCDVGGWTGITQIAGGGIHTVGLKTDGTLVAAGPEAELARWNLVLGVPPSQCVEVPPFPRPDLGGGGGVRFCFIATVAYGSPMAGEIEILRRFRDEYLLTNPVGQALVDLYYRTSPPVAEFITEHPSLKPMVRVGLAPAVAMSTLAVNTAPAEKAAIVGLLVLVSVALVVRTIKRRGRGTQRTWG
jgi:hypothetical protein